MDDNSNVKIHGRKRLKLDHNYCLSGQLVARSHILHCQPPSILIEICTEDSVEYIINEQQQTFMLMNTLEFGQFYKFRNLATDQVKLTKTSMKCFRFTKSTRWKEIEPLAHVFQPSSLSDFTNITGKVTQVDDKFAICYINDSVMIILSACSRIALHHMPKVGQDVTIFNTHRVNLLDGKVIYVLCAKSFISIPGDMEKRVPTLNLSPLQQSLGDVLRDFRLILWLQECLSSLEKNLSDEFLQSEGISLHLCDKFRFTVLKSLVQCVLSRNPPRKISFLEEFLSSDHKVCCGTLQEEVIPYPLLSLSQAKTECTGLETEFDASGVPVYWCYDVKKDRKRFVIGLLSVKNSSLRLCLSDALCSMNCLVLSPECETATAGAETELNKSIVLAWDHDVVWEKFCFQLNDSTDRVSTQILNSFVIHTDKTKKFLINSRNEIDVYTLEKKSNKFCIEHTGNGRDEHPVPIANTLTQVSKVKSKCLCLTKRKSTPLQDYLSQYIIVQTKSSVMAPSFLPDIPRPARSYILVSLLGKMVSTKSMTTRGNDASTTIFLSLEKSVLQVHPLLCVNTVYEIRFPFECDGILKKRSRLSLVEGLTNQLPTINCVTLPGCCEIYTVPDFSFPAGVPACRDFYGIDQAVKEANVKELIDVVGFIVERYHQDPRFEREKIASKANGFGVPGCQLVALVLRDTPPGSQTGTPATLYHTYLPTLQYPIGLVPGAKVMFRFVMKVCPSSGSKTTAPYFRSSILTSVEILELAKSEINDMDQCKKVLWGPRSLLNCALSKEIIGCQWLSVSMTQLVSVSLTAKCSSCEHPVSNSKCTFVGCSATEPKIFSQATFIVQEFGCKSALVFVPNASVPKLFQDSDKVWSRLERLTLVQGQISFKRSASKEVVSQLSLEDKVFRVFCKIYLAGQRYHVLCRKFNSKARQISSDLHSFYAIDISPVTMLMALS